MSSKLCAIHLEGLDDNAFEEWLRFYLKEVHGLSLPPQRNGRSGQSQAGVDLYFRNESDEWVGVQAKAYKRSRLTSAKLDLEIKAAHAFEPALTHYIVCTLNDRDATLQAHARKATIHGSANVQVLSLQDLAEEASHRQSLMVDLLKRSDTGYMDAMRLVLQPAPTPALAPVTQDPTYIDDATLRAIGDWIEAGDPRRALTELAAYIGPAERVQRVLVEARANFALGELDEVIQLARNEECLPQPSAVLLAFGAHAAALQGNQAGADAWLNHALAIASVRDKPQVVGAYLRVHAQRSESKFSELERFARGMLGDPLPVALALADTAFQLDDLDTALFWYEKARARQAHWPPGARCNELGGRIWKLICDQDSGGGVDTPLRDCADQLTLMLKEPNLRAPGLRQPLLINLGHARRVLGEFQEAAAAWDEALAMPDAPPSLWIHRCVLSAMELIPLPSEKLIERWAITHTASLVLASACTMVGSDERAAALIETVLADATASTQDLVLAHIEKIRLATSAQDDRVTPAHVSTMLGLVDLEEPSLPLFAWLVGNYRAAAADQSDSVRVAVFELAKRLPVDPKQREALVEDLMRAQLYEAAILWLPEIEREAWPDRGRVTHVSGAIALLSIYALTFRVEEARRLVSQMCTQYPQDAHVVLQCARALHLAGNRLEAYGVLTDAIRSGVQDGSLIGSWSRLAVMLKRKREAHRILRDLQLAPRNPEEYGQFLQARALLGINNEEGLKFTSATQVTPGNAVAVFTSGLMTRSSKAVRVAYGRVIHLQIFQGEDLRMDEHVMLHDEPADGLTGVRALTKVSYPWITELLGAQVGEIRKLTTAPFSGHNAVVVDVIGADRWNVTQAAQLVHLLPPAVTGVETMPATPEIILEKLSQQANASRRAREGVLNTASEQGAAISLIAAAAKVSARAMLRACPPWRPTGHPGSAEEINADDQALADCSRLVLDPVALLLMVDIGMDSLISKLPAKPVMSLQAAWQIFDWWYEHERHHRGTAAHVATSAEGEFVLIPVNAERRREARAFWKRVLDVIINHVELMQPPPITNTELQKSVTLLGAPVVSGMAIAAAQGWVYLTEEAMLRAVVKHIAQGTVSSVHRLLVVGVSSGWWHQTTAIAYLATLMRHGWSWVSFPISMLHTALRLPEAERWPTVELLLRQIKRADLVVAIGTLFMLLRDVDKGAFHGVDATRLRKLIIDCLPIGMSQERRWVLFRRYAQQNPGRLHRTSRRCVERWANNTERA